MPVVGGPRGRQHLHGDGDEHRREQHRSPPVVAVDQVVADRRHDQRHGVADDDAPVGRDMQQPGQCLTAEDGAGGEEPDVQDHHSQDREDGAAVIWALLANQIVNNVFGRPWRSLGGMYSIARCSRRSRPPVRTLIDWPHPMPHAAAPAARVFRHFMVTNGRQARKVLNVTEGFVRPPPRARLLCFRGAGNS